MGRDGSGVRAVSGSSVEIAFTYKGVRFRPRVRLKPTAANLRRAERHLAAIQDAIERDAFDPLTTFPDYSKSALFAGPNDKSGLIRELLERWLEARRPPELAASTWHGYDKIVRGMLIPAFGEIRVAEFKRQHARDWVSEQNSSLKRIRNVLSVLRAALDQAVEDELISTNPLNGWTPKRRKRGREVTTTKGSELDPFTRDESEAIVAAAGDPGGNALAFAFWTGARPSELIGLMWTDVDWRNERLRIQRGMTQAADIPEEPKTTAGDRMIDLLPPAMAALRRQLPWSRAHPSGYVFLNPRTGEPWKGDEPLRKTLWTPALRKAGVRYRRPYQMRHTYASRLLSAGEPIPWVAAQMGHHDPQVTFRVYYKFIPDAAPDAGAKVMEQFGKNDSGMTA